MRDIFIKIMLTQALTSVRDKLTSFSGGGDIESMLQVFERNNISRKIALILLPSFAQPENYVTPYACTWVSPYSEIQIETFLKRKEVLRILADMESEIIKSEHVEQLTFAKFEKELRILEKSIPPSIFSQFFRFWKK